MEFLINVNFFSIFQSVVFDLPDRIMKRPVRFLDLHIFQYNTPESEFIVKNKLKYIVISWQ